MVSWFYFRSTRGNRRANTEEHLIEKRLEGEGRRQAKIRDLKQPLYGKKSEKSGTTKNEGSRRGVSTRPRG